ncbi:MAG: alkyl hydroperoxide reductase subunit F, partial [Azovibrio sp.]
MLDANIKTQLKTYLERIAQPVELIASLDDTPASGEMRDMLQDITSLSDLVSLREDGAHTHRPSFAIAAAGQAPRIHFSGIPMGHEFTSLVLALLQTGGYPPKLDAEVIEQIRGIEGEFHFETFISLSCHNCPEVVQ